MKKKALFVHHYSFVSGAEKVLINILHSLDTSKFELVLCCPCGELAEQSSHNDIKFYPCNIPILKKTYNPFLLAYFLYRNIAITTSLVRIIRKERIDIIYANSFIACLFCCLATKLLRTPLIWHMHDLIRPTHFNSLFVILAGKYAYKVIATSNVMKSNLIACGVSAGKIETVYNGIDRATYTARNIDRIRFRNELGLSAETLLVGIVGQLTPWKGHREFLYAASIVIKKLSHIRFLIVGDSRLGNNNWYRRELESMVLELGLENYVVFTGFRKDVREIIGSLDILVNASWAEPFGMTIIEAMALSVPVVATRAGGLLEIIEDGVNGILFDVGNAEELAQKWIDALENPDSLKGIRHRASAVITEKFLLSDQASRIEDIILNY